MIVGNKKFKLVIDGCKDVGHVWNASNYQVIRDAIEKLVESNFLGYEDVLIENFHIDGKYCIK